MIKLRGTGSSLPAEDWTNEQLMDLLGPMLNPKSSQTDEHKRYLSPGWIEKMFGFERRRMNILHSTGLKPSREEGGKYDGDLAVEAILESLKQAAWSPSSVESIVHVSCSPDFVTLNQHFGHIRRQVGLSASAHPTHHSLGCAGLAAGLKTAKHDLLGDQSTSRALVVATNCTSGYMATPELRSSYVQAVEGWARLTPLVFADGGAALALERVEEKRKPAGYGLWVNYGVVDLELVKQNIGGNMFPVATANFRDGLYTMAADKVRDHFPELIDRAVELLRKDWEQKIRLEAPEFGELDLNRFARIYFHQANAKLVKHTRERLNIDAHRAPINADRLANTSAASTALLLNEDMRGGKLLPGDKVLFLWVGAGYDGAMFGYCVAEI